MKNIASPRGRETRLVTTVTLALLVTAVGRQTSSAANPIVTEVEVGAGREVALVANPTDPDNVIVGTNYVEAARFTTNGGSAWPSASQSIPGYNGDPWMASNEVGTVYNTFIHVSGAGVDSVGAQRSTDKGATFTAIDPPFRDGMVVQIPGGSPVTCVNSPGVLNFDRPETVSRGSYVYVYALAAACGGRGVVSRSVNGGITWDHAVAVSAGSPMVAPDGDVYLVRGNTVGCPGAIALSVSTDNALTFTDRCVISFSGISGHARIASDPANANSLSIVFIASPSGTSHIFESSSFDGGLTWRTPTQVDHSGEGAIADVSITHPSGGAARIGVAWSDTRNSIDPEWSDLYYTYAWMADNPRVFAPDMRLTMTTAGFAGPPLFGSNDYITISTTSQGNDIVGHARALDGSNMKAYATWISFSATPPGAPGSPSAQPGSCLTTITWSPPPTSGGAPVTNYVIHRGTTSGGETALATIGRKLSFTDLSTVPGTTYYYKIAAVNGQGTGPLSSETSATPATSAPPTIPLNLVATGGPGQVALTWTPSSSCGGSPIVNQKIYRGTTSGGETLLTTIGTASSYVDAGLSMGTYYYKITGVNAASVESAPSAEASGNALISPPTPPTGLTATPGNGQVSLSWTPPGYNGGSPIAQYKIFRKQITDPYIYYYGVTPNAVPSFVDSNVLNGVTYGYAVAALNGWAGGESALSNEGCATPSTGSTVPCPPASVIAVPGNAQVALSWTDRSNGGSSITSHTIYRSFEGGAYVALTSGGCSGVGTPTTCIDTTAASGQTYYYKASATNAIGESVPSYRSAGVTPSAPPDLYFVCPATTSTSGSESNCGNMQSSSDANAVATLTEQKVGTWRLDQAHNANGVGPTGTTHTLQVRGRVATSPEQLNVQVWSGSAWTTRLSFLTSDTTLTLKSYALTTAEWSSGSPKIRFLHQTNDNSQSTWEIDYVKVVTGG